MIIAFTFLNYGPIKMATPFNFVYKNANANRTFNLTGLHSFHYTVAVISVANRKHIKKDRQ